MSEGVAGPRAGAAVVPTPSFGSGARKRLSVQLSRDRLYRIASFGLLAVVLAPSAFAALDENKIFVPSGSGQAAAPSAPTGGMMNTVTLVLALALAAVGAWMMWKKRGMPGMTRDTQRLAVEETKSLGNRQYLVVASYDGKKFLLGVCPGRIDLLAPLNDERKGMS